jgi:hypothetical protein
MSVTPNFLSRFCQAPSPPVVYTEQDIVDDFIKKVEEAVTQSQTSEVYVKYVFPDKFKTTFFKKGFWNIIQTVLVNQMNFSRNTITFAHDQQQMNYKEFYYFKIKIMRQYNEEYAHEQECRYEDEPDGVVLKMYVPKN